MKLSELADKIDARLIGEGDIDVTGCSSLDDSTASQVSFLANRRYVGRVKDTQAAAVIVSPGDADDIEGKNLLVAEDPYFAFRQAVMTLHGLRKNPAPGISQRADVHPEAKVGKDVHVGNFVTICEGAKIGDRAVIYPNCFVGPDAEIGDDCILHPNVVVYDHCVLGDRVTLQAGCIIGQDGFGYSTHNGVHHKIPQIGRVLIGDDVEMGANCAIDRATVGDTVIAKGSKFSNAVTIGHGAKIGEHNLLVAQVGVAGSVETGKYVAIGGQAGIAGHLKIGDQVQIAAKAGVASDLAAGGQYGGQPAIPFNLAKRAILATTRLPDMIITLRRLERRIAELEGRVGDEMEPTLTDHESSDD